MLESYLNKHIALHTHLRTYLKVQFCTFVKSKAGIPQFCNRNAYKKRRKRNVSTLETFLNKHIALHTELCTYLKVQFCVFVKFKAGIPQFCNLNAYIKRRKRNVYTLETFL